MTRRKKKPEPLLCSRCGKPVLIGSACPCADIQLQLEETFLQLEEKCLVCGCRLSAVAYLDGYPIHRRCHCGAAV
jgi:hypothetical protein